MPANTLEERITRLEDLESIKQLKARYCEICDDDHNFAKITSIFTEDGIWEGKGIAKASGHQEIVDLFKSFQAAISFSQHMVQNPIIEIDGDRARGRWYFFGMFTFYDGDARRWQAARYHEEYVKQDEVWKIKHLLIAPPAMNARYETGWHNGKQSR
ncbi:MAG: hypothetical protein ACI9FB_003004 [Candidatus Azotimanducaceae bacterium]|jgi:hypothetical protein